MNPSEVDERLEVLAEAPPAPTPWSPSLLRLGYALEFLIALIAIISVWSEIGGQGHLDLMPWYIKLACIAGLAWCSVRFTAAIVEQKQVWTRRTISWFAGILLFCVAMGAITYYYHLHEEQDDGDDDNSAAARNITSVGTFFCHASKRTEPSIPIYRLARSAISTGRRIPAGSNGRDPGLRM
jgi:hypothetical protein